MANISLYFPKVLQFSGGYVNNPIDKGGPTNMDVTLDTFQKMGFDNNQDGKIDINDLKLETPAEAQQICKKLFWDRWQADKIINQSIAESLVEWVWGSGVWGIKIPQRMLSLTQDGNVGPITLAAVNTHDPAKFHEQLRLAKMSFIMDIVKRDPSQGVFFNGWRRRINSFIYTA